MYARTLLLVLALALLAGCATAPTATPTPRPVNVEADAWFACTMFVERQFDLSVLDAQDYTPGRITKVRENAWMAEIAYASHGAKFLCSIIKRDDGNWQLVDLQME